MAGIGQTSPGITGVAASAGGGVTSLNGMAGAITIVAGANITVTPGAGTITIASSGGSDATSIQGVPIDPGAATPADGDILQYDLGTNTWFAVPFPASTGWQLTGNALTPSNTKFLGSTDNFDFSIRRDGLFQIEFLSTGIIYGGSSGGILQTFATGEVHKTVVVAGLTYNVIATDDRTIWVRTNLNTVQVNLPAGVDGQEFIIKDSLRNASVNNITIVPDGADVLETGANLINTDGGCLHLQFNAFTSTWQIIGQII